MKFDDPAIAVTLLLFAPPFFRPPASHIYVPCMQVDLLELMYRCAKVFNSRAYHAYLDPHVSSSSLPSWIERRASAC